MPLPTAHAVQVGVLVGVGNLLIYNHFVGASLADIRLASPMDDHIEKAERTALVASTAFTVVAAGFVQSWETFAIGGLAILVADFAIKHANAVNPMTGKVDQSNAGYAPPDAQTYPSLADYGETGSAAA
jgi:hypothetical protein